MGKFIMNTIGKWKDNKIRNQMKSDINTIINGRTDDFGNQEEGHFNVILRFGPNSISDFPKRKVNRSVVTAKKYFGPDAINVPNIDEDTLIDKIQNHELFYNGCSLLLPFGSPSRRDVEYRNITDIIKRRSEMEKNKKRDQIEKWETEEREAELEYRIDKYFNTNTQHKVEEFLMADIPIKIEPNRYYPGQYYISFIITKSLFDKFFNFFPK